MNQSIATGLILTLLTTAAQADTTYTCNGRSTMTYVDATGEMLIKRPGKVTVSIPPAPLCSGGRMSGWSATPGESGEGCGKAPYAEDWVPAYGPRQLYYTLDAGKLVDCVEVN